MAIIKKYVGPVETAPVCANCGSRDTYFRLCEKCWSDAEFPAVETAQPASEPCEHKRLNENGICRKCGINVAKP